MKIEYLLIIFTVSQIILAISMIYVLNLVGKLTSNK